MPDTTDIQLQLDEKWLIFWWALGISLFVLCIAWLRGFFKPFSSGRLPEITGEDVLRGFGLFLAVEGLLIPVLAGYLFTLKGWDANINVEAKGWLNLFMVLGGFASALFAYKFLTAEKRKELWQQNGEPWLHNLKLGIISWFVISPTVIAFNQIVSLGMWHLFHHPFNEQSVVITLRNAMDYPVLFGALALAIVTLIPFTEEYLFRGLLQTWLKRKFGSPWPAVLLTSFIFSLFHFTTDQGLTNVELLASLFLLSCMLGYIFERQRSLWAPIGLHSFFNFMSLLMIFNQ